MIDLDLPLLRGAIWISVAGWATALVLLGIDRSRERLARASWTIALVAYLVHVAAAFAGPYRWSHRVALEETARQTGELTGIDSGAGLWLNYLVGVLWIADTSRWWATGKIRPFSWGRRLWWTWQLFLAFMIFNGTVVFGHGPVRWFGIVLFVILAAIGLRAKVGRTGT